MNDRVRRIVDAAVQDGMESADEAVLQSLLLGVGDADSGELLKEFFDVELIVRGVYDQFVGRGRSWDPTTREKLAEALAFHGLDAQADAVRATLR